MKRLTRSIAALLLSLSMIVTSVIPALAATAKSGWVYNSEEDTWSYYEKDGTVRANSFAFNNAADNGIWNAYYLDENGSPLQSEGGTTIMTPDGGMYDLTPYGAVKGGQLVSSYDETTEQDFVWYTDKSTGQLSCGTWRDIEQNGDDYWFYFAQLRGSKKGIGAAVVDQNKKISNSWYHFDEEGRMVSNEFVEIGDDEGIDYKAYAQLMGDFAEDKWLFIEGNWYYFQNKRFEGQEESKPVAVTGIQKIDGNTYEFDDSGTLNSEYTPYRQIESVDISSEDESVYVGKTATIDVDIKLATASDATPVDPKPATPSEATPATPSEATPSEATPSDATPISHPSTPDMSSDEMHALEDGKVYDIYLQYDGPGSKGVVIPITPEIKGGKLEYKFTPKVTGTTELSCYVDGKLSNTITITCEDDETKKNNTDYLKSSFSGVLNSQLPSEEVVSRLGDMYSDMDLDTATSLRNDDDTLSELEKFEKVYMNSQGLGVYKYNTDSVKDIINAKSVSSVGAYLNADVNAGKVTLGITKSTEDISHIEGAKKVSLDITLDGGNIDPSKLDIPVTITMDIPNGLSKDGLKLYHIHDGVTTDMKLSAKELANGKVRFTTDSFSTFVFTSNSGSTDSGSGHSGGSSGGSSSSWSIKTLNHVPETAGHWELTNLGWTYIDLSGNKYTNTWIYVKSNWYWIESTGIMTEGWKEVKGVKYYLMPGNGQMVTGWINIGSDWYYADNTGAIKTGWVQVNGKWYYMNEAGLMVSSTTTPDGYKVNANGEWVK